jgi:hypothetical protein
MSFLTCNRSRKNIGHLIPNAPFERIGHLIPDTPFERTVCMRGANWICPESNQYKSPVSSAFKTKSIPITTEPGESEVNQHAIRQTACMRSFHFCCALGQSEDKAPKYMLSFIPCSLEVQSNACFMNISIVARNNTVLILSLMSRLAVVDIVPELVCQFSAN